MHNKNIIIMDSVIKSAAEKRYENDIKTRSAELKVYYSEANDKFDNLYVEKSPFR